MRGDPQPLDKTGAAVTILIIAIVVTLGFMVHDQLAGTDIREQIQEDVNGFESYCTERFGDDVEIYNSQSVSHGGLHCSDGDGTVVHLSQIPAGTLEDYRNGEISAHEVTASLMPVRTNVDDFYNLLGVTLVIAVVLIVINMLRLNRGAAG